METSQTSQQVQFLVFRLDKDYYAFDVLKTKEVLSLVKITPLPGSRDHISGVINLRGTVVPVINLRTKFSIGAGDHDLAPSIIIVETLNDNEASSIGVLVDSVRGVIRCDLSSLEDPPKLGAQLNSNAVKSIVRKEGDFVMVLDVDNIFSEKELWAVKTSESQLVD